MHELSATETPDQETINDANHALLVSAFSELLCAEVISEMAWRLLVISLSIGIGVILVIGKPAQPDAGFAMAWIAVALLALVGFQMFRQRQLKNVYPYALCVVCASILWWGLIPLFYPNASPLSELSLVLIILTSASIPWAPGYNLFQAALFATAVLCLLVTGADLFLLLLAALLIPIGAKSAAVNYLSLNARVIAPLLVKACESFQAARSSARLLASSISLMLNGTPVLILLGPSRAEIIFGTSVTKSKVDSVFIRGLLQRFQNRESLDGVLSSAELGDQFKSALLDWFGKIPTVLFVSALPAIIEDREETIYVLSALPSVSILAGSNRTQRSLIGLAAAVRISLGAARSRFLSTDVLSVTERAYSEREQEFNQLVHTVNNTGQEIAIVADNLKELLKNNGTVALNESEKVVLSDQVIQLEGSVRNLSANVSDLKWLKELSRLRDYERMEVIELEAVLSELERYGKYRSERKGELFTLEREIEESVGIRAINREFLEASMRFLLRLSNVSSERLKKVQFRVYREGKEICFRFSDTGEKWGAELLESLNLDQSAGTANSESANLLRAVLNFARLSKGRIHFVDAEGPFVNSLVLALQQGELQKRQGQHEEKWVLFVDDKAEVTSFYSRVAEALELDCETAASVDEAQEILLKRGSPNLVVTDIELGPSSGLDLVQSLRTKFGKELPIIVVSGHSEIGIADQVYRMGATKYLTKPVGRGKLFSEIRDMLELVS